MTKLIQCSSWINYWREAIVAPSTDVTRPFWVVNRGSRESIAYWISNLPWQHLWLTDHQPESTSGCFDFWPARPFVRSAIPPTTKPDNTSSSCALHSCADSYKAPAATRRCFGQNFLIGNYAGTHLRGSHAGNLFLFGWFIIFARGNEGRERGLPNKLVK